MASQRGLISPFFRHLKQDLVDCLNAAYEFGKLYLSQHRGLKTLIPNEGSNPTLLSSWGTITLLTVDYAKIKSFLTNFYRREIHSAKCSAC